MTDTNKSKAAAIKEKVNEDVQEVEVDDVEAVVDAAAKSAAADLVREVVGDDDGGGGTPSGKRRFFPRVKHLLTPEWEFVSYH